jgi:hypothetical protein
MQLQHWIGTNAARTVSKRGANARRQIGAGLFLALLAGCSPALFLELQNEADQTVYVQDFAKGTVAIEQGSAAILNLPARQFVVERPQKLSFDLKRPPSKHVHTTGRGLFVYGILTKEGFLYLATKSHDGKLKRMEPQPDGFPLQGK